MQGKQFGPSVRKGESLKTDLKSGDVFYSHYSTLYWRFLVYNCIRNSTSVLINNFSKIKNNTSRVIRKRPRFFGLHTYWPSLSPAPKLTPSPLFLNKFSGGPVVPTTPPPPLPSASTHVYATCSVERGKSDGSWWIRTGEDHLSQFQ